jgi:hypothetical protein
MGLVVREWLLLKVGCYAGSTCGGVDGIETRRQGLGCPGAAKLEDLIAFEEAFDGLAETRPELNLSGDGTLNGLAGYAGVKDERVGKLDWLAHVRMVA